MKDSPLITLTTDFGLSDHYVGTMKGVILSRSPEARIIDITHEIEPFSVWSAAYTIDQAAPYFPAGTIHVVVIDPGVGTERKALLIQALGQKFIGPDNGVFSFILARDAKAEIREIQNGKLRLDSPSLTFHGRDVFAPAAAILAAGQVKAKDVGPRLSKAESLAGLEPEELKPGVWQGKILSADRFGNLITNFKSSQFQTDQFGMLIGQRTIRSWFRTFGEAPAGRLFLYRGSSGFIEVGLNRRSAAAHLKTRAGAMAMLHERRT